VITYMGESLGTTLLGRESGLLWPPRTGEYFDYGSDSALRGEDPEVYWAEVRGLIEKTVLDEHVDHLLL
jgi:hypothetical protein